MSVSMRGSWAVLLLLAACGPASEPSAEAHASGPVAAVETAALETDVVEQLRAQLAERDLELAELREQRAVPPDTQVLTDRVALLEIELSREQQARLEREQEWLGFTRAISALELASVPDDLEFVPQVPEAELAEPEPTEPTAAEVATEKRRVRAEEIQRTLVALLTIEDVRALSLLDVGQLGDGWIGPVLFRITGAGGRLAGSLYAQRLRLEGSQAARTLTLVLEDGYETREGVQTPFMQPTPLQPGVRRIVLPYLDPLPWAESLPELFGEQAFDEVHDDGRWNLTLVRGTLNLLLREDAAAGWYRLRALSGVTGDVLRDVHLLELDAEGNTRRHLFADRLKISIEERGVLVSLEDGASMKGPVKTPFVAGKLLLYFPRADHAKWITPDVPLFHGAPAGERVGASDG